MREGWKQVMIADLCKIKSGKGVPAAEIIEVNIPGTFPCYGGNGQRGYIGKYSYDGTYPIIGRVGALCGNIHLATGKFYATEHALVCSIHSNTDAKFLCYLFLNMNLRQYAQGAAQPVLSAGYISNLATFIPSLPEQQRIVDILDREFAKIDALKANAEKSLQAAKDLFQATLKKELEPKEGWNKTALGTLCEFSQGLQVDVKDQHSKCDVGMVRFLRIIDFTQGTEAPRYIIAPDKKYYLQKDGIAMVRYGTVGYVCYGYEGVIANNLFKIEVRNGFRMLNKYLFYVLKSDIFQSVIRQGVGGVAMPAISFGMIRNIIIPYPTEETFQKSIVSKLDNLNEKCNTLQENYQKTLALCDDLKQALLRKAFNGEL